MKKFSFVLALVFVICFAACSGSGTGTTSGITTSFNTVAQQTLPVLNSVAASSIHIDSPNGWGTTDGWGNMNYELYAILGDPSVADSSSWGSQNVFNVLNTCDSYISSIASSCTETVGKVVTPPFNFGNAEVSYDCGANKQAVWKISGTTMDALLNYSGSNSDHQEISTLQGQYDESTGALSLDLVGYNSYDPADSPSYAGTNTGKFIMRMEVRGNATTHAFTLRMIKRNPGAGSNGTNGYEIDIVGKGISRGSGNYFLFRVKDSDSVTTSTYYCFPASVTEAQIQALVGTTYANIDANCASYAADVAAMKYLNDGDGTDETDETTGVGQIPLAAYDATLTY